MVTREDQLRKKVVVKTVNGSFTGVLLDEHDRNFGGCVEIMYEGTVYSHSHSGKIIDRRRGMKKMTIPSKNIIRVDRI